MGFHPCLNEERSSIRLGLHSVSVQTARKLNYDGSGRFQAVRVRCFSHHRKRWYYCGLRVLRFRIYSGAIPYNIRRGAGLTGYLSVCDYKNASNASSKDGRMRIPCVGIIVLVGVSGCYQPKTETPTSGQLSTLVTESLAPLMQKEAEEFHRLYPNATVTILPASTRDAVVQMLNDSVRLIIIDRPLNAEERGVAERYGIEVVQTKIAEDALAVIV